MTRRVPLAVVLPFTGLAVLVAMTIGYFVFRPNCADYQSWDACEASWHCGPAHLIVMKGHQGPIWECEPR